MGFDNTDTWTLLEKELNYFGIELIDSKKCRIYDDISSGLDSPSKVQGVIRTIREINGFVRKQKKMLLFLWEETIEILQPQNPTGEIVDERMTNLFTSSLKDMLKFLLCFESGEKSKYYRVITEALAKDIRSFNKQQIYTIPDYKISIDWVNRTVCRLLYICKLLAFACMGKKRISTYEIKTARGIAGPFTRLDLPMKERIFPFGREVGRRIRGRQKQRRYTKGLQNYNNDGRVGEGYMWRELRNEPFSWFDRNFDDPYPSRYLLSR